MPQKSNECGARAFRLFAQQLPALHTTAGLWKAAAAISMHALEDVKISKLDRRFNELAERVLAGVPSGREKAKLAHLHSVLFEQEQFCGDFEHYYNPLNAYLPAVLESCTGLPILLGLVYKVVAERVGLEVEGLNSPGHFLVRVKVDSEWMMVDPYFHGQLLTIGEALERLQLVTRGTLCGRSSAECFLTASNAQWLVRILKNLQNSFSQQHRSSDLAAMRELEALLDSTVLS